MALSYKLEEMLHDSSIKQVKMNRWSVDSPKKKELTFGRGRLFTLYPVKQMTIIEQL